MSLKRPVLRLVPLGPLDDFQAILYADDDLNLREFLNRAPALATEPMAEELMERSLRELIVTPVAASADCPLYRPPGLLLGAPTASVPTEPVVTVTPPAPAARAEPGRSAPDTCHPTTLSERDAVRLAYGREIEQVASLLSGGLSVLVICDKLVVEHLWQDMARRAGLRDIVLSVDDEQNGGMMPLSLRQRQLAQLKELTHRLKIGDVLVIPHLDLLAGGPDRQLANETREFTELAYTNSDRLMLAFADRSLVIPEVLADRFAVRLLITGVARNVLYPDGREALLGHALITRDEAARIEHFDAEGLYKNVAGMNPVQIRHAITYAVKQHAGGGSLSMSGLYQAIRAFKVQTSLTHFEVPEARFEDIGGYQEIKAEIQQALNLIAGSYRLPNERLRRELIPRGFIFHGPPGTGKTLFAKAIANRLNATVQVVSGPEVMDMYVGESERKIRDLFAEARRNAPAVLVFDEFDAIAAQRSGRADGGNRAGNAVVAQILTEMDGFRPDVPMLVIGTTNRLDIIDTALLRPSRFQAIAIGLPDTAARRAIAEVHARHFQIDAASELLEHIAATTPGFNGDEIRSLFRDVCVGLYCEDPPHPANLERFEALIERIRRVVEQRAR